MKIVSSVFYEADGVSIVTIQTNEGMFTGEARLHPDDRAYANHLTGCRIAESRAIIKYLKHLLKQKRIMLETTRQINKDLQQYTIVNKRIQHRINLQLRDRTNEIKELKEAIQEVEESINKSITIRDNILKAKKR